MALSEKQDILVKSGTPRKNQKSANEIIFTPGFGCPTKNVIFFSPFGDRFQERNIMQNAPHYGAHFICGLGLPEDRAKIGRSFGAGAKQNGPHFREGASWMQRHAAWRRRWDSNPRTVLPITRFRVEAVMTTSIRLRMIRYRKNRLNYHSTKPFAGQSFLIGRKKKTLVHAVSDRILLTGAVKKCILFNNTYIGINLIWLKEEINPNG